MRVHIRLLGGFEVTVDDRPIPAPRWRRRSAADLVKLLALRPERRLRREQVIDALWPDLLLDDAGPRLHTAAHYARTALDSRESVVLAAGAVSLFPDAEVTVDVRRFEQAADAARATAAPDLAARAVDLYAGDLLPDDLYEPWTEEPRARLRLRYLDLLRSAGRYEELVAADPLDEEAYLMLVEAQLSEGRRQTALRSLDGMAEVFRRELGVEPGPAALTLRRKAESLPETPAVPRQRVTTSGPAAGPEPAQEPVPDPVREPAPAKRPRTPLPAPRKRLIGRHADVEAVHSLLRSHRVVTITGPGGAGKSTLALSLARDLQAAAPEAEVVLAELAPVRDEAGVVRAVAEAAGIQGEGAIHRDRLAALLGPRRTLLVLDNVEHLIDAGACLVDAILDAGEGVQVLATSREPLQVDGEAVHLLGSLGADSAELFAERALAAAGPDAVSADDPRVVDLCERLDGLPLAIELAAAQLRHLGLQDLVDRLDDRLTLLAGGRPRAGRRHTALTTTIDWSYRLLTDEARRVFDRLGVFPASFDLETVQAVCADLDAAAVTNLLGDLVAKSLVVHDPTDHRYRLLETIRLFAARRLDEAGLRARTTERLRSHVASRVAATPRVRTWLSAETAARSRDDLDNVRLAFEASLERDDLTAAVDIALGLSTLWRNAVSYAEGRRWVSRLRERDLSPADRLWTLILTADVGLGSGDPRLMREAVEETGPLTELVDDPGASAITAIYEGMSTFADPEKAIGLLDDACARTRRVEEPGLERLARAFRVVALLLLGVSEGLDEETRPLTEFHGSLDYDRYISLWAASLVALADRDRVRLRRLMDAQLADLMASGLRENWLTMYWGALALVNDGEDYLPQLRRARVRAQAEGRQADADCVLALAYAAACRDDWETAAELLGTARRSLLRDTASFVHHAVLREQLVRPRLDPGVFAAASSRGERRRVDAVLAEHDL